MHHKQSGENRLHWAILLRMMAHKSCSATKSSVFKPVTVVLALAIVSACAPEPGNVPTLAKKRLVDIASVQEVPDFRDITLGIEKIENRPSEISLLVAGLHNAQRVAMRLVVQQNMNPGVTSQGIDRSAFHIGGIRIESVGKDSDRFVSALAQLYAVTPPSGKMRNSTVFTAFPLEGDPRRLLETHVNMKVFHDEDNTVGEYCELYVHVDVRKATVEIHEKDPKYRSAVIKALSQPPA